MDDVVECPYCCQLNSIYDDRCMRCGRLLTHEELMVCESQNGY